ncbi:uncharacterized protein LOC114520061 [Dendronephthya gigantea]|uniref:uncharacterized protein LOC114520061 n=1 Tax=Dendronephthya gigantea TaxID=151771 RepID=UPI00106CAC4F|nr:uncharacterized protein LOC114520061 [Dendronephthya gigantea]
MMSRSKKQQDMVESDSDWDSLPGDITEPRSSPEPMKSPSPRAPTHSPAPPKQPYSKHHTSTKPFDMYKNSSTTIQKSGSATTFQDKTSGLWNDDDNNEVQVSFSKEDNNNVKKNKQIIRDDSTAKNVNKQEGNKEPPFTDFREALSSPAPTASSPREQHKMAGVNKAYKIETGDETGGNRDSWDESDDNRSPPLQQNFKPAMRACNSFSSNATRMPVEISMETTLPETKPPKKTMIRNDVIEVPCSGNYHLATTQNLENCCLIQVAEGAFDDRHRPSFFHGSKNHFHIKEDNPRPAITDIADKSEMVFQRLWREVFGVLQILLNFFIIFILEFFKTILQSVRYLLMGILYTTGDQFIKPVLAAVFNNIIQPVSVLLLNVFSIVTNLLQPILALTREVLSQVAIPLQAFRLFVFNWDHRGREESYRRDIKIV